jgi:hypothetical protein
VIVTDDRPFMPAQIERALGFEAHTGLKSDIAPGPKTFATEDLSQ